MNLIRKEIEPVELAQDKCRACVECEHSAFKRNWHDTFCENIHTEDDCDEFDADGKIIKSFIWVEDGLN
jgi:hypothetical protein